MRRQRRSGIGNIILTPGTEPMSKEACSAIVPFATMSKQKIKDSTSTLHSWPTSNATRYTCENDCSMACSWIASITAHIRLSSCMTFVPGGLLSPRLLAGERTDSVSPHSPKPQGYEIMLRIQRICYGFYTGASGEPTAATGFPHLMLQDGSTSGCCSYVKG